MGAVEGFWTFLSLVLLTLGLFDCFCTGLGVVTAYLIVVLLGGGTVAVELLGSGAGVVALNGAVEGLDGCE